MNRKRIYASVIAVSAVLLVLSLSFLIRDKLKTAASLRQYEDLAARTSETAEPADGTDEPAEEYVSPVDFQALWDVNREIIAWITVPGTGIDYPVARRPDDDTYYLEHDIYGNSVTSASIYMESYNKSDFSDFNTVIYGHNMNNGTMFAPLHKYESREFFDENRSVFIYLPDRTLEYRIIAAGLISDRHILSLYDSGDPLERAEYIGILSAEARTPLIIDETAELGGEDRIITLSTCDRTYRSHRFVVAAKLVSDSSADV